VSKPATASAKPLKQSDAKDQKGGGGESKAGEVDEETQRLIDQVSESAANESPL
jgi:hypothetical protein